MTVADRFGQNDCGFEYYKEVAGDANPAVDCETAAGAPFNTFYLEGQCNGTGSEAGLGVELDWLRAFWDVHTNSVAPTPDPTFTEIVEWLVGAGAWDKDDAYTPIDTAADARNDQIDANWNTNGVNTPLDGLQ